MLIVDPTRATQKREQRRQRQSRGDVEMLRNVRYDRVYSESRILPTEPGSCLVEECDAHIDRHVEGSCSRAPHGADDNPALLRASGSELYEGPGPQLCHELGHPAFENCPFGPGLVILRQPGDLLE